MASDAADGGGGRKEGGLVGGGGKSSQNAISDFSLSLLQLVSLCWLHIFSPYNSAHSLFPFFLCFYELWTFFFSSSCQLSSSHPSSPQGPLCCLWMRLIWTPRGSLARPHSSTPWKVPLSSVSTHAQVCACAYVLYLRVCVYLLKVYMWQHFMASNHYALMIGVRLRSDHFFFSSLGLTHSSGFFPLFPIFYTIPLAFQVRSPPQHCWTENSSPNTSW